MDQTRCGPMGLLTERTSRTGAKAKLLDVISSTVCKKREKFERVCL